jgi:hypothetical protein
VTRILASLSAAVLAGCSVFGIRSGYEQPRYEVVERLSDDVEIRRYGAQLVAETVVEAEDPEAAQNDAFKILAGYLFGANRSREEISMTAPVEVRSEKIAMTVPVETSAAGASQYRMRFFLPASLSLETAPQPNDSRVKLLIVPERTAAVLRFSGLGREAQIAQREMQLLQTLRTSRWRAKGAAAAFYYDPPGTIPFLRRNEVVVAVEPA